MDDQDRLAALTCLLAACNVKVLIDDDGDGIVGEAGETSVDIETIGGSVPILRSPKLAWDGAGRMLAAYVRWNNTGATAVVAHDRDDDGTFSAGEIVPIENFGNSGTNTSALTWDGANNPIFVYWQKDSGALRVAWDRNGDGDFLDNIGGNDEVSTIATGSIRCVGAAVDTAGNLAVTWGPSAGTSEIRLLWDSNGDADFDDAGERFLSGTGAQNAGCDVVALPSGGVAVAHTNADVRLMSDRNGDRDFLDPDEDLTIGLAAPGPVSVSLDGDGQIAVLTPAGVFRGFPLLP